MPEPVATAVLVSFLGPKALEIVGEAVKKHVQTRANAVIAAGGSTLSATIKRQFGKEEQDALEAAYGSALTHAYSQALEALGNVLNLVVTSGTEFIKYRVPVENFLNSGVVAEHLFETVRDLSNSQLPDPTLLEREWAECGGPELPFPGVWHLVTANFRKGAQERTVITPDLREILNAQNLTRLVELVDKLRGVQIVVKHQQYVSVMRKRYAQVELANIAPAHVGDHGVLVVTDVFEPQHVRENPPPVEIAKDELEQLAKAGKLDGSNSEVIAMLEDGDGQDFAQNVKFQRASYAEQPVRPVLDVISGTVTKPGFVKGTRLPTQPGNPLIVITGEPGSGKSTLLRYLLLGILDPPVDAADEPLPWTAAFTATAHEHFPFLIELRDYHFTCEAESEVNSLMDYARYLGETMGYGINDQWLDQRLKSGPSLILFDGLDEIFDPKRRDHVMQQIVGFTETYPLAQVIVTSRPHGYHEGILRPAGFAHFRLQDLDRQQKAHFTRAWFQRVFPNEPQHAQQRIDRVLDSVDRSPSVRWLAGNPLLLTIMCLIARERELPEERAEFYEQCLDVLVHQWEVNNHLETEELAFLTVYRKKELLRRIAFEMQASKAGLRGNFIAEEHLLQITRAWFEETYDNLKGTESERAAQKMVEGLWQRNYVLCPRGPKLYGFLHRTFMEFLTATEYVRRFEKTDDFTLADLDAVFRAHGNDPEWSEVLRLICGEIGEEFADPLIRTLLTLREFPTKNLTEENQPNHLVLGLRCMSELRGLSKMDDLGVFALERCVEFIKQVSHGEFDNPFMMSDLIQAANEIGTRWPSRMSLIELAPREGDFSAFGHQDYPDFDAAIVRDRRRIETYALTAKDGTMRRAALRALTRWWADEDTRQLLRQRAVEDENDAVRSKSLELLAGDERWADESTRQLLRQCAVDDDSYNVRSKSLELLAGDERWADESTGQLLRQRAVDDEHSAPRSKSLELLAGDERWADEDTRQLLRQRAVEDESWQPRSKSLE
ncbi:MAG: HEAT repeat domain-containing protein, partial [Rhodopirellula sp.]|nr:HEAT repeat domain-containing protein [Rhodopirellula sp.]